MLKIDSSWPACQDDRVGAQTSWSFFANLEIGAAEIVYCSRNDAGNLHLALHEFGHTLGLRHSPRRGDVMAFQRNAASAFQAAEALAVHLMYQRRAGNRFPDNDRQATGTLMRGPARRVACQL